MSDNSDKGDSGTQAEPVVPADLADAMLELPLFPLQQVVLFPGMLLPLHVFEKRYCTLIKDALDGHRALAIPLVSDPDADMAENPPFEPTACVGTIVDANPLPRGRFSIVLLGRARVRLQELTFTAPYRRALATLIASDGRKVPPLELATLHNAAAAFVALVRHREESFKLRLPKDAPTSALVDAYAHQLIIDPKDRQAVLADTSVRARVQRVTEVLTIQRATLGMREGAALN